MKAKGIATSLIAGAVALGPVQSSAGDALAGAVVGAVIGGLVVNEMHRNKARQRTVVQQQPRRSTVSSSQREANREVQVALNHFGYNVGTPDGALGPKSRSGISQYQALLGYPPTGQLTDFERTILIAAHQRAVIGGPATMQLAGTHPQGLRGLLVVQRDEMAGLPGPGVMAAAPAAPAAPAPTVPAFGAAPAAPAPGALPNFFGAGGGAATASLASHCNRVSLLTNTNGGFVTLASMTDPVFALSEQFCLARTYAMAQGEELVAKLPGATPQQIAEQCAALGPALEPHVTALSLKDRDAVLQGVQGFALDSGMAPAQLAGTARICLGSGYTTDSMPVAVGSALVLTVLGERGYAELLGHHLSQGFGASQRSDLALAWYEMGLEAAGPGATMVFAPGMADRAALIRKAAFAVGGKGDRAEAAPAPMPVFALPETPAAPATPARSGVEALPLAARLPFMVFGN